MGVLTKCLRISGEVEIRDRRQREDNFEAYDKKYAAVRQSRVITINYLLNVLVMQERKLCFVTFHCVCSILFVLYSSIVITNIPYLFTGREMHIYMQIYTRV